jgi:predicted metal-dependent hydrolase
MAEFAHPSSASTRRDAVEVRRSARRRRTVSAYRDGDKIVVLVPARLSRADEQRLVSELVEKITRREASHAKAGARRGDTALMGRARELSQQYLDGRPQPISVRWVRNMKARWGSCTMADRTIRLSHRLQPMPSWVIDYVLMHELAHLLEPGHGPRFWAWVNRYPRTERARGYLEGVAMAAQLPGLSDCDPSDCDPSDGDPSDCDPSDGDPSDLDPLDGESFGGRSVGAGRASVGPPRLLAPSAPSGRSLRRSVAGRSVLAESSGMLPVLAEPSEP